MSSKHALRRVMGAHEEVTPTETRGDARMIISCSSSREPACCSRLIPVRRCTSIRGGGVVWWGGGIPQGPRRLNHICMMSSRLYLLLLCSSHSISPLPSPRLVFLSILYSTRFLHVESSETSSSSPLRTCKISFTFTHLALVLQCNHTHSPVGSIFNASQSSLLHLYF